jgi:peptidoglycan/xylan/chitin deacetylase (PgdA/CDA1 family)
MFPRSGAILCFHSITTPAMPAAGSAHLPLAQVTGCLRIARRMGEIVPLENLLQRHRQGRSTAGLIAVTFDDAYASLGLEFKQFIEREAVHVTVFVVTGAAARGEAFWWDRLDDLFPRVEKLRWRNLETRCGLPEEYRRLQPKEHGPLRPLRQWILTTSAGRCSATLDGALSALEEETCSRTHHRAMTFAELDELTTTGLVGVGVHTVSHPVLPLLGDAEIRSEIKTADRTLRERFGTAVPVLAVPYGLYDRRTLRIAAEAGMAASLTLDSCTLGRRALPDGALPRFCATTTDRPWRMGLRLVEPRSLFTGFRNTPPIGYPDLPSAAT